MRRRLLAGLAGVAAVCGLLGCSHAPVAGPPPVRLGPVTDVSLGCHGGAEAEAAAAPAGYVYEVWIGCQGIGFARSTDGGRRFSAPVRIPGSLGESWDPAIAVAPGGTLYAAYMHQNGPVGDKYPVVAASFDHGATFRRVTALFPASGTPRPPARGANWGDRDFIAAGPDGHVYVTWDYGPSAAPVRLMCARGGSCAYAGGDLNAVIQESTDGGRTWGPPVPVVPGFPRGGGYSAPLLVRPGGRVDVLVWGHHTGRPPADRLRPGHEYFASAAGAADWPAHPVEVGPRSGSIALPVWWIDGDLSADAGGTLYATWDTQAGGGDTGWVAYSRDGGRTWSRPVRVTSSRHRAVHIVEVAGGAPGVAYVAWQSDASHRGYTTYLRPFSPRRGWLAPTIAVSAASGARGVWPGDTFGIARLPGGRGTRLVLSWGAAAGAHARTAEIYSRVVTLPTGA